MAVQWVFKKKKKICNQQNYNQQLKKILKEN